MSGIINQRIKISVRFHDIPHGLQKGRIMGNTPIKSKLLQQLIEMREEVFNELFIDLQKACDSLERE